MSLDSTACVEGQSSSVAAESNVGSADASRPKSVGGSSPGCGGRVETNDLEGRRNGAQ